MSELVTELVPIQIFIICYNESLMLPNTIAHYRRYLPSATITIYDNESTDNSVELAKSLGCNVVSFTSNNIQNEYIQQAVRNECWMDKENPAKTWVIALDMDEWLCITEADLHKEYELGTSIITVKGYNMIGESQCDDFSDIDLHYISKAVFHSQESKNLCFLRGDIEEMNYVRGGHSCTPKGRIQFSDQIYINKHLDILGLPYLIKKTLARHERTHLMRHLGIDGHYINDIELISQKYNDNLINAKDISELLVVKEN